MALRNLLTLGEDLLVEVVKRGEPSRFVAFYEIPVGERDPECPVRIRVGPTPEMLKNFPPREAFHAGAQSGFEGDMLVVEAIGCLRLQAGKVSEGEQISLSGVLYSRDFISNSIDGAGKATGAEFPLGAIKSLIPVLLLP